MLLFCFEVVWSTILAKGLLLNFPNCNATRRERERERLRLVFGICGFVVQEFLAHPKPGVHTKVERDEVDVKKRSQKILLVEKSRMVRLTEESEFPGMESATS